jgi:hypothetical protein
MKRQRIHEEKSALDLAEEAFQLLRQAPASAFAAYYLGSLPFILALLFFWSDMARSAFAEQRLGPGALAITILFLWMKGWQGIFARHLFLQLCRAPQPRWKFRCLLRTTVYQIIVQPFGLFLLPAALILAAPFGWAYAFFANVTVFSGGDVHSPSELIRRSWKQAKLWPMQSNYVLFMFQFFGLFVLLNLLSAVLAVPLLMKMLLGIETVFSQSPWAALNSTLLMALVGLTYLCLDPVMKATYALRCFYGESLHTGADLEADLKGFRSQRTLAAAILILIILHFQVFAAIAHAAQPPPTQNQEAGTRKSVSTSALDRSIDEVIRQREYSWRMPREKRPVGEKKEKEENFIQRFFNNIESALKEVGRWVRDFMDWLDKQTGSRGGASRGPFNFAAAMRGVLFLLIVIMATLITWLLFRIWKHRQPIGEVVAEAISLQPDVSDENIGADQLPEEGWIRLARELLGRGEMRLALRAFYLATLAHLADRNLIILARFKSNRDYEQELNRRSHALPELPVLFSQNVTLFERVWYGLHEVTPEMLEQFAAKVESIKARV